MPKKAPDKYEAQHYRNINAAEKTIDNIFRDADFEISYFVKATYRDNKNFAKSIAFVNKLKETAKKLHDNIVKSIGNSAAEYSFRHISNFCGERKHRK